MDDNEIKVISKKINDFTNDLIGEPIDYEEPLNDFRDLTYIDKIKKYTNPEIIERTGIKYTPSKGFTITRAGKTYPFRVFYNKKYLEYSDQILFKSKDFTGTVYLCKTLQIVGSGKLANTRFIIGTTLNDIRFLVKYEKNGENYIIDIDYDVIMKQDDYYELLSFKEKFSFDVSEVYAAYYLYREKEHKTYPLLYFYYYQELVLNNLSKFDLDTLGFDNEGINYKNYFIFDRYCDVIFLKRFGFAGGPVLFERLNDITLHPEKYEKDEKDKYHLEKLKFRLLSSTIVGDAKEHLLSEERFGVCFRDSYAFLRILKNFYDTQNIDCEYKLVVANVLYDRKYGPYHAWGAIKLKDKWVVIDTTQNLIMPEKMYYQYVKPVNVYETSLDDRIMLEDKLGEYGINLNSRIKSYFTKELLSDMKRLERTLNN